VCINGGATLSGSPSNTAAPNNCNYQVIFGAQLNTASLLFSGTIGLGISTDIYGSPILAQFGNQWGFVAGVFENQVSTLTLGGVNKGLF
jgi:hypothetical protein